MDRGNSITETEWESGTDEFSSEDEDYWRAWFNDTNSFFGRDDNKISYDDLYRHFVVLEEAGEL